MEIHALHQRGWKIADIARHTGRDRKTIRSYLNGTTTVAEQHKDLAFLKIASAYFAANHHK